IEKIDLDEASLAEIRFEKASSQFTESASEDFIVNGYVVLSKAMPVDVCAKVKMAGSAEKNSDFVAVNDVVYFKAGTTASKFKYLIKKDLNAAESTEYIDISFAELQNAKLSASGPNTHRLSIVNNANVGSTLDPA